MQIQIVFNENGLNCMYEAPSKRIRISLNLQLILSGYRFCPHASGEFGSESGYFLLCVDGEMFESGKKKMRIRKYPETCGRVGISLH